MSSAPTSPSAPLGGSCTTAPPAAAPHATLYVAAFAKAIVLMANVKLGVVPFVA